MEKIKEISAGAYAIFTTGWVLFHLLMIAKYGTFLIGEQYPWIVYTEIALLIGLLILQIERFVKDLK